MTVVTYTYTYNQNWILLLLLQLHIHTYQHQQKSNCLIILSLWTYNLYRDLHIYLSNFVVIEMTTEQLTPRYVQMQSEPGASMMSSFFSFRQSQSESTRMFDELPKATIMQVSRPDASDISPMLLSYTIEFRYKQVLSTPILYYICMYLSYFC